MGKKERVTGYYWVRSEVDGWQIAKWYDAPTFPEQETDGSWSTLWESLLDDGDFLEIDEKRLER